MRNGDYPSTRLEAQNDAVVLLIEAKLADNVESTVGLLSVSATGARLIAAATEDKAKLLANLHGLHASGGAADFVSAVKTAALALKHRKNVAGGQRVIVFTGSPIGSTNAELKTLGEQLRKNNVSSS